MVHGKLHNITDKKGAELLSTELCLTTPTKRRGTFGAVSYVTPEMGASDIELARHLTTLPKSPARSILLSRQPPKSTVSPGAGYCAFVRPGIRK